MKRQKILRKEKKSGLKGVSLPPMTGHRNIDNQLAHNLKSKETRCRLSKQEINAFPIKKEINTFPASHHDTNIIVGKNITWFHEFEKSHIPFRIRCRSKLVMSIFFCRLVV